MKKGIPKEGWQNQQKARWSRLASSDVPNKQIEQMAKQMITGREWLFQQGYSDQSPLQKAVHDVAATAEITRLLTR
jgi:hypothetical protein